MVYFLKVTSFTTLLFSIIFKVYIPLARLFMFKKICFLGTISSLPEYCLLFFITGEKVK